MNSVTRQRFTGNKSQNYMGQQERKAVLMADELMDDVKTNKREDSWCFSLDCEEIMFWPKATSSLDQNLVW